MPRVTAIPLFALLICSCNTADSALGVNSGSDETPAGSATRAANVTRVDLGTLGGGSSYAAAINAGNTVVGWSETPSGATHAFRWSSASGMIDLGTLPGDAMSRAVAILDADGTGGGQILGVSGDGSRWTPVVWSSSGTVSALSIPLTSGFTTALPAGLNSRGDVVGSDAGGAQRGWIWSETGGKTDLSAGVPGGSNEGSATGVTSAGLVVLTASAPTCTRNPECWRTYLWTRTTGYQTLGLPGSDAEANVTGLGMNESGTVTGWVTSRANSGTVPYRWNTGAGFTFLANYASGAAGYGFASAVNANGAVVGADFEPGSGSIVASTWLPNGRIVRLSPADPNPSVALAINTGGTIAGWAAVASGVNHAVVWQPTSQGNSTVLRASASVSVRVSSRVSTASSACLGDRRSISSRQALFACVINADHKR